MIVRLLKLELLFLASALIQSHNTHLLLRTISGQLMSFPERDLRAESQPLVVTGAWLFGRLGGNIVIVISHSLI